MAPHTQTWAIEGLFIGGLMHSRKERKPKVLDMR